MNRSFLLPLLLLFHPLAHADFESAEASYRAGNHKLAAAQYQEAADAEDIRAYGKLGALYLYGVGVEKDRQKAYLWFGLANATGDKEAERFQKAASAALTRAQVEETEKRVKSEIKRLNIKSGN